MKTRLLFLFLSVLFICPLSVINGNKYVKYGLNCTSFNAFGVQRCVAGINSSILNIRASDPQHASQWCWAASIQAVFNYYGYDISQEQIVEETWGRLVNNPGQPDQIVRALNREWIDDDGYSFYVEGDVYSANAMTAAQDLANDQPLIIGTLGHAMVLTGLEYDRDGYGNGKVVRAIVRDPWPYSSRRRELTAQEWYGTSFLARIRVHR